MRILIIHDRDEVAAALSTLTRDTLPNCVITVADDVLTARERLKEAFYDLAVIDLTLPIKRGQGAATLENAQYVLDEIFEGGDSRTPGDILGISKEPEVLDVVTSTIGQHLMGCIREDAAGRWHEAFVAKLRYVKDARRTRQLVYNSAHDVDVVVVTALDKEARSYGDLFELRGCEEFRRAREFSFVDRDGSPRRGVLYSIGQSGQAPAGSATQALITHFRPRLILMTGFCGGIEPRVAKGDLVAFKSSSAWDYGKWVDETKDGTTTAIFQPRPGTLNLRENGVADIVRDLEAGDYAAPHDVLGAVAKASDGAITAWKLRCEGAGSGSAVVTSLNTLGRIGGIDDEIRAIDMESYAFYYACRKTHVAPPDFLCVKSVADFCNGEKNDKLHAACSLISASFAKALITQEYDFSKDP